VGIAPPYDSSDLLELNALVQAFYGGKSETFVDNYSIYVTYIPEFKFGNGTSKNDSWEYFAEIGRVFRGGEVLRSEHDVSPYNYGL
jgi:hypothetical protein